MYIITCWFWLYKELGGIFLFLNSKEKNSAAGLDGGGGHITDLDDALAKAQLSISSSATADLKLQLVSSFPLVIQ